MKDALCSLPLQGSKLVREKMINNLVLHLHTYKMNHQTNQQQQNTIIVPDTLKVLPLYMLAVLK
jgi:hypothetical protein